MKKTLLLFFITLCTNTFGQTENELKYRYHIKKAIQKIKIDGIIDESDWQTAQKTTPFWQAFPYDTSYAKQQTETRFTFDKQFLYVCHVVQQPKKYVVQSLKRDFPNGGGTELVLVNIDTFKDKQNAFHFAVNPYGVQREGLVSNGEDVSNDWDNKWYAEVKNYADHWVVEIAIPFKTLRYRVSEGTNEWNISIFRNNLLINERSSWTPVPRSFRGNNIARAGVLVWDTPPPTPGANISVIPYVLGGISRDYLNNTPTNTEKNIGFDAKVAVTPSLNLDVTVNPDFAQVEVDQQVTNLSRFELFFPERRQFFLENADLFGGFGATRVNPFFSRRIGLIKDKNGNNVKNRIVAGARLSGKLNNNWRVGLLDVQTGADANLGIDANNFLVATVQRRVFSRSNVSAIFVNRQNEKGYNRVAGFDYNLGSKDGFWSGKLSHHQMFGPVNKEAQFAQGAGISYNSPKFGFETSFENVGQNYTPEVGFVPRNGYIRNASSITFTKFPKSKILNSISLMPDWDVFYGRTQQRLLDWDAGLFSTMFFQNGGSINLALVRWEYTYLFADFDPSGKGDAKKSLKAGTEYTVFLNRFMFQTNPRRRLSMMGFGRYGGYFNGKIKNISTTLNYRYQPYVLLSLGVNYNQVRLPAGYNSSDLWIISPRADVTLSRSVFFTTFMQYNNQTNNMNINARFQWRFKPVSDLFIVYTDNYFTQDYSTTDSRYFQTFDSKNRALVLKLSYWFNV